MATHNTSITVWNLSGVGARGSVFMPLSQGSLLSSLLKPCTAGWQTFLKKEVLGESYDLCRKVGFLNGLKKAIFSIQLIFMLLHSVCQAG